MKLAAFATSSSIDHNLLEAKAADCNRGFEDIVL
jgi:hypothetical protein